MYIASYWGVLLQVNKILPPSHSTSMLTLTVRWSHGVIAYSAYKIVIYNWLDIQITVKIWLVYAPVFSKWTQYCNMEYN